MIAKITKLFHYEYFEYFCKLQKQATASIKLPSKRKKPLCVCSLDGLVTAGSLYSRTIQKTPTPLMTPGILIYLVWLYLVYH